MYGINRSKQTEIEIGYFMLIVGRLTSTVLGCLSRH